MTRPHGLLRAGYPYLKTLGMRRITNFPTDIAFGEDTAYIFAARKASPSFASGRWRTWSSRRMT